MFALSSSAFDPRAASSSSFFNQHAMQQPSGQGSGNSNPGASGPGNAWWNRPPGQQGNLTSAQRLYELGGPPPPSSAGSFAQPSPGLGPQHSPYGAAAALTPAPQSRMSSESSRFAYYPPEASRDIGTGSSSASSWTDAGSPIMSSYPGHSSYHAGMPHTAHMAASPYAMPPRAGSHYFAGAQGTERGNSPPPIWEGSDMGSPRLPQASSAPSTSHGARSMPSSYAMAGRSLGRPGSPPFGPSTPLSLLPAGGSLLPPLGPSTSMPSSFLPAAGDMGQHHVYSAHRQSYGGSAAYGYGAGHSEAPPTGYTSLPPPVAHMQDAYGNSVEVKPHYFNAFEVKHRRRTTKAQFKVLEGTFQETPKPSAAVRKAISDQLNMPPRAVQIWFQNRRAKAKAVSKKEAEKSGKTASASASDGQDLGNQDQDEQDEVEQSPEQEQSPREARRGEASSSRLPPPPPSYPDLGSGSGWQRGGY